MQGGLSAAAIRSNVIKQQVLGGPFGSAFEALIDVENTDETPGNEQSGRKKNMKRKGRESLEFTNQKDNLSSILLPSEVCFSHCQVSLFFNICGYVNLSTC